MVFSDQTLGNLEAADAQTAREIEDAFNHWDDIDVHFRGRTIRSGGHGFCGIGRKRLLSILQRRARALDVELRFQEEVIDDEARWPREFDADVVACDDQQPRTYEVRRDLSARHRPAPVPLRVARHQAELPAFTFAFEATEHGWFQAHAYQYEGDLDVHRRDARGRVAAGGTGPDVAGEGSRSASGCSRATLAAIG